MKKTFNISKIPTIIVYAFVALWAYAAFVKLVDMESNRSAMLQQPFPAWMGKSFAWSIPVLEIAILVLLIHPTTRFVGLVASMILMASFSIYILLLLNGVFEQIPCACGGIFQSMGHREHLTFNTIFTVLAFLAIIISLKNRGPIRMRRTQSRKERMQPSE